MTRLTDRLERELHEIAAEANPSPSAWESIAARLDDEGSHVVLLPAPASARGKRPAWLAFAAAAVVVIVGWMAVLTSVGDDQSISTADLDLTATFVSPRNGFSVQYPAGASVPSAGQLWGWSEEVHDEVDVVAIGPATVFRGTSQEFPGGFPCLDAEYEEIPCGSTDERIDRDLSQDLPGGCGIPRSQQAEIIVDGQPGRIAECAGHIEATVVHGGRLYVFTLAHDGGDARAVFDAVAATIDLTPETVVEYPEMTTTFASPTYGYSFKFHDRGGVEPATQVWDPDNQRVEYIDFDPRFDGWETGYGAYFEAASTPIPAGVTIDAWVDEYVTPVAAGGCGVPRGQQDQIIIDGQPGRIARCHRAEATVVAGGRLYLFIGPHDDREWFEAWAETIELTPETAAVP